MMVAGFGLVLYALHELDAKHSIFGNKLAPAREGVAHLLPPNVEASANLPPQDKAAAAVPNQLGPTGTQIG